MPERKGKANPEDTLEDTLVKWLQRTGNYVRSETMLGMRFAILAKYPQDFPAGSPLSLYVVQPEKNPYIVGMATKILFSEEQKTIFRNLGQPERDELFRNVQDELLFRCDFQFQFSPEGDPVEVQLSETLYLDGPVGMQEFYDRMRTLWRCYLLIGRKLSAFLPKVTLRPPG